MVLKSSGFQPIDRLRAFLGRSFGVVPISANTWTVLALLPALGGLYALTRELLLVGLVLFTVAGALDVIDGAVARERGETTAFGAYLDGMTDRFVEAALLVGLMLFGYEAWLLPGWLWLTLLLFFGTAMTSFARAYADHQGIVTEPDQLESMGGLLERAERLLFVFASMVVWYVEPIFATYVVALATGLAIVTVFQRMLAASALEKQSSTTASSQS